MLDALRFVLSQAPEAAPGAAGITSGLAVTRPYKNSGTISVDPVSISPRDCVRITGNDWGDSIGD
jgi:hypothetical protein